MKTNGLLLAPCAASTHALPLVICHPSSLSSIVCRRHHHPPPSLSPGHCLIVACIFSLSRCHRGSSSVIRRPLPVGSRLSPPPLSSSFSCELIDCCVLLARRGGTVRAFLCTSRWRPSPPTLYPTRSTHSGRILSPPSDAAASAIEQCSRLLSRHHQLVVALCGFSPSHLPPPPLPILPLLLNDDDVRGIVVKMLATPPITHYLSDCHRLSLRPFQWLIVVVAIHPLDVAIVARSVPLLSLLSSPVIIAR
jgi:hypothetical protein